MITATILILIIAIICYTANSPHCRKHIFTRMVLKEKKCLTTEAAKNLGSVLKYEKIYVCPKCGEKYITTETCEQENEN